jgi:DNA-binding MarR family transcriptional regulator
METGRQPAGRERNRVFLMDQVSATLFSLANKLQTRGDKYFEKLTIRQFMAMLAILHLPDDEATLNQIARKLGTSKQNSKQVITIIEKKGYVATVLSRKDRRAVNVRITTRGKRIMKQCAETGDSLLAEIFKELTLDELKIMWDLLKKVYRFDGEEMDGFEN